MSSGNRPDCFPETHRSVGCRALFRLRAGLTFGLFREFPVGLGPFVCRFGAHLTVCSEQCSQTRNIVVGDQSGSDKIWILSGENSNVNFYFSFCCTLPTEAGICKYQILLPPVSVFLLCISLLSCAFKF